MCRVFVQCGTCRHGSACKFMHGDTEAERVRAARVREQLANSNTGAGTVVQTAQSSQTQHGEGQDSFWGHQVTESETKPVKDMNGGKVAEPSDPRTETGSASSCMHMSSSHLVPSSSDAVAKPAQPCDTVLMSVGSSVTAVPKVKAPPPNIYAPPPAKASAISASDVRPLRLMSQRSKGALPSWI